MTLIRQIFGVDRALVCAEPPFFEQRYHFMGKGCSIFLWSVFMDGGHVVIAKTRQPVIPIPTNAAYRGSLHYSVLHGLYEACSACVFNDRHANAPNPCGYNFYGNKHQRFIISFVFVGAHSTYPCLPRKKNGVSSIPAFVFYCG